VTETGDRRDARARSGEREPAGVGTGGRSPLDLPDPNGPKRDKGELVN
jgi:hypothetical protein